MPSQSEAFSRVHIDEALRDNGWDLKNPQQVRFELNGANGRPTDQVGSSSQGGGFFISGQELDKAPPGGV